MPEDIAARIRRRWDDGSLLRAYANGDPFDPIEVRLRGPTPSQVGDDIAAVREWIAAHDAGRRDDGLRLAGVAIDRGQTNRPQSVARAGGGVDDRPSLVAAGDDRRRAAFR